MPNINAALGIAQMNQLPAIITRKRWLAERYRAFFRDLKVDFFHDPPDAQSNYWLNAILLINRRERDEFLNQASMENITCRPAWDLINTTSMYRGSLSMEIPNSIEMQNRLVNLPSSVNFKLWNESL